MPHWPRDDGQVERETKEKGDKHDVGSWLALQGSGSCVREILLVPLTFLFTVQGTFLFTETRKLDLPASSNFTYDAPILDTDTGVV